MGTISPSPHAPFGCFSIVLIFSKVINSAAYGCCLSCEVPFLSLPPQTIGLSPGHHTLLEPLLTPQCPQERIHVCHPFWIRDSDSSSLFFPKHHILTQNLSCSLSFGDSSSTPLLVFCAVLSKHPHLSLLLICFCIISSANTSLIDSSVLMIHRCTF